MMRATQTKLNSLATECHDAAIKWWYELDDPTKWRERSHGELGALLISELAEMMEGVRKSLPDDKLVARKMEEVEAADAVIRMMDTVGRYGFQQVSSESDAVAWRTLIDGEGREKVDKIYALMRLGVRAYDAIGHYNQQSLPTLGDQAALKCFRFVRQVELYCIDYGLDLWGALEEKMIFNASRSDFKAENRKGAFGKAF